MLMCAIAGVDNGDRQVAGEKMRRTRCRMPHHYSVGTHCGERIERVYKRLAFRHARGDGSDGDEVGAKPFRSDFEAGPSASRCFKEQIYNRSALQGVEAFEALAGGRLKIFRPCQDSFDFRARERLDIKQTPPHGAAISLAARANHPLSPLARPSPGHRSLEISPQ